MSEWVIVSSVILLRGCSLFHSIVFAANSGGIFVYTWCWEPALPSVMDHNPCTGAIFPIGRFYSLNLKSRASISAQLQPPDLFLPRIDPGGLNYYRAAVSQRISGCKFGNGKLVRSYACPYVSWLVSTSNCPVWSVSVNKRLFGLVYCPKLGWLAGGARGIVRMVIGDGQALQLDGTKVVLG